MQRKAGQSTDGNYIDSLGLVCKNILLRARSGTNRYIHKICFINIFEKAELEIYWEKSPSTLSITFADILFDYLLIQIDNLLYINQGEISKNIYNRKLHDTG